MAARARAALYHRVSTVDQNPHLARRELVAAARRMGLRVELDVRETGKGANNDRPGLVRVLEAAQRGSVDVVLVWKLDRFGRSAFDLAGGPPPWPPRRGESDPHPPSGPLLLPRSSPNSAAPAPGGRGGRSR